MEVKDKGFCALKVLLNSKFSGLFYLVVIYLGAILFAGVLSPFLYWAVQYWQVHFPNELNTYLIGKGLDVYFDRLRWVPLLLGITWMLKICKLDSLKALGFVFKNQGLTLILKGLLIAFLLTGTLIVGNAKAASIREGMNLSLSVKIIITSLCSGLLLSVLEETVFRGFILRLFSNAFRPITALVLCSLFFAYTHFKIPDDVFASSIKDVHWYSGLLIAYWTLVGITHSFHFWTFFNLFLLGLVLGLLTLKTKNLMFSIGFHMGIIWFLFCFKKILDIHGNHPFFGGSGSFTEAPAVTLMLIVFLWAIGRGTAFGHPKAFP